MQGMVWAKPDGSAPDRMPDYLDTVALSSGFDSRSLLFINQ